tara:strand:+ start:3706 stop:4146 length:441 start_codon:yes stop_codon:yes gene_type:complete
MNITVRYGLERRADLVVEDGTSIAQVLDRTRPALGFGSNVKALIGGVTQPDSNTVRDGDEITVETAANCKAADEVTVQVKYGLERSTSVCVPTGSTIEDVLGRARTALGFGSNVKALIDGAAQPLTGTVTDGDIISVETAANSKAV